MAKNKTVEKPIDHIEIDFDKTPILYTDNVNITSNKSGVVLNVMQRFRNTSHLQVVARVGMSREHAKNFVEKMGRLLIMTSENSGNSKDLN